MDLVSKKFSGSGGSKLMTLAEAVSKFVQNGCSISVGGNNGRNAMAAAYEIIRQGKKDLVIIDENSLTSEDVLIGAGCIKKVETSYMSISMLDMAYNFRRAIEHGVPRQIEIDDYTNYTGSLRFMAAAMNVPFLPTRSLLGSDIPKYNKNIKIIKDPYGGGPIALIPAANLDVAFIPVQRCDVKGNAQIWGHWGPDDVRAKAAKATIIICEEIIPTEEIEHVPNMTTIPSHCVDAVVCERFICHPWDCYGYYYTDMPFLLEYAKWAKSYETFKQWLEEWVFGVKNHTEYCRKVGWERLMKLETMAKKLNRIPV